MESLYWKNRKKSEGFLLDIFDIIQKSRIIQRLAICMYKSVFFMIFLPDQISEYTGKRFSCQHSSQLGN